MFWGCFLRIFPGLEILISSRLISVQGVQNEGPRFQFTHCEGVPIFGLRALKNSGFTL